MFCSLHHNPCVELLAGLSTEWMTIDMVALKLEQVKFFHLKKKTETRMLLSRCFVCCVVKFSCVCWNIYGCGIISLRCYSLWTAINPTITIGEPSTQSINSYVNWTSVHAFTRCINQSMYLIYTAHLTLKHFMAQPFERNFDLNHSLASTKRLSKGWNL